MPRPRARRQLPTPCKNIALVGDHIVSASNIYGGTYNLFAHTLGPGHRRHLRRPFDLGGALRRPLSPTPNLSLPKPWVTPARCHRHRGAGGHRPPQRHPLIVDNTFATPYLFPPHRVRSGYRSALRDQVYRRARHRTGRRHYRLGQIRLDAKRQVPRHQPAQPLLLGRCARQGRRKPRLHNQTPHHLNERPGRGDLPLQLLPAPARARDPAASRRAPCSKRPLKVAEYLKKPPAGGKGKPPLARNGQEEGALRQLLPERRGLNLHLRD